LANKWLEKGIGNDYIEVPTKVLWANLELLRAGFNLGDKGHIFFTVFYLMENKELWISVLDRLKPTISKPHFLTWFQHTAILRIEGQKIVIGVPSVYAHDWLKDKFSVKILQAINEQLPEISEVVYEINSNLPTEKSWGAVDVKELIREEEKKVRKIRNFNEVRVQKGFKSEVTSQMLNTRYTLNNFIVGMDNRLPHAAAMAVSNMPGGIYNPLYIYGKVGIGKTHLLQAIGNEIVKYYPEKVIKYVTAERFVTEVVEAIGKRYMQKFKDQYRNVDCFLVDDVQFFARKDSSQQEFFHTFNELYQGNKQIVITSDRSPSELDDLDERLKSRFGMGMVVELLMPDFETKVAILQQKCRENQVIVDPGVLEFIAMNINSSVRALEGVLKQIIAECQLFDRVPTIKNVAEIIKRMDKAHHIIGFDIEAKGTESYIKTPDDVISLVSQYYNISKNELVGSDRHVEVSHPRQICMYLIKNELNESYERIGSVFGGRNHTTVMHACTRIAEDLKKNVRLVRDINVIKKEMGL